MTCLCSIGLSDTSLGKGFPRLQGSPSLHHQRSGPSVSLGIVSTPRKFSNKTWTLYEILLLSCIIRTEPIQCIQCRTKYSVQGSSGGRSPERGSGGDGIPPLPCAWEKSSAEAALGQRIRSTRIEDTTDWADNEPCKPQRQVSEMGRSGG